MEMKDKCLLYIRSEIYKVERSIEHYLKKPNASSEEWINLQSKLATLKHIELLVKGADI